MAYEAGNASSKHNLMILCILSTISMQCLQSRVEMIFLNKAIIVILLVSLCIQLCVYTNYKVVITFI